VSEKAGDYSAKGAGGLPWLKPAQPPRGETDGTSPQRICRFEYGRFAWSDKKGSECGFFIDLKQLWF
jgi:hypothetical protein